jgi:1,4-alpha-glucan branching enzyme
MTVLPDLTKAPMGGTLVPGGATFRVWAPRAKAVHVSGDFNGWTQDAGSGLAQIGGGHWASFVPGLKDGDQYLFCGDLQTERDTRGFQDGHLRHIIYGGKVRG